MKKIIKHLKKNWHKYALETLVVVNGIWIAFTLNNWKESREFNRQDIEFLSNLRIELSVDITGLSKKRSQYRGFNDTIARTIQLFDQKSKSLTPDEHRIISSALTSFQILTPVFKHTGRNDLVIAQGRLDRIDNELNRRYLAYLEETQSENAIITKLGETLQRLEMNYVSPHVDYNDISDENEEIRFDYEELRDNRMINNALQRSFGYREFYLKSLDNKIKEAESLMMLIERRLSGINV